MKNIAIFIMIFYFSHSQVECQLEYTPLYCPYDQVDFSSWDRQYRVGVGQQALDKINYGTKKNYLSRIIIYNDLKT